jgi:pimeloyl-ACP methyl ester carboxylesterase
MKLNTQVIKSSNPQAKNIVFLHAFPLSQLMWKSNVDKISEKHNCYLLDLPGFGISPTPNHPVSFEYYVESVKETLEALKLQSAVLCGLSMGGYLCLRLYEIQPNLFSSLILCDTKSAADNNEAKIKRAKALTLLLSNPDEFNEQQWKNLIAAENQNNLELKKHFFDCLNSNSSHGVASALVALATRTDTQSILSKIKVPTLILVGEKDAITPPHEAENLHKNISQSQLQIIPKAGHLSALEKPQEFNNLILNFLSDCVH